ncbi:hypothetical protein FVA74_04800 [Salinibacterium sp. dk2585]|nr:hypothetical protein FVA74_04800 [Salinibacterium sp. dk2585]TXK56043.1 hypothetical protein FVP63_04945 [Salinibacterium sp. dk5596]
MTARSISLRTRTISLKAFASALPSIVSGSASSSMSTWVGSLAVSMVTGFPFGPAVTAETMPGRKA